MKFVLGRSFKILKNIMKFLVFLIIIVRISTTDPTWPDYAVTFLAPVIDSLQITISCD